MTQNATFGFTLQYVSDVQRAKRFFTDVLGLQVDRDHPTFVQFKTSGGAYALASDERMQPGRDEPEVWWVVEDAQSAFAQMSAHAEVAMPLRQMPFGTCFGIKDPSGQVHYVVQLAGNRPSQAV